MFAGHDTTRGSFCAFAHYLNKFPNVLRKLLIEEVQSFSKPLDMDELKAAPVLSAFTTETWRLASPLGAHIIKVARDLDFRGYKVKKGVNVALSIQSYNANANGRYRDPLEFRIERLREYDRFSQS
jgi:cytochrome P450